MNSPLLTRRDFLFWSGALGASVALPLGWIDAEPVRMGFVGLGERGRQALSTCLGLAGAKVVALCDRQEEALRSALAGPGALAGLATREARQLFAAPSVDAVVLAASEGEQLGLAAAACAAGKDVFLLRPLPFDSRAWKALDEEVATYGRQVQVARATAFALDPEAASGLAASREEGPAMAEVEARFQSPRQPDAGGLLGDLLDEVDFVQAVLGGRTKRSVKVGGPGILPGLWTDQRLRFELAGAQGVRWMGIHLIVARGPAVPKTSRVFLGGDRGAVQLAGSPLPAGHPLDLGVFLRSAQRRETGAGLSPSRVVELTEQFLAAGQA